MVPSFYNHKLVVAVKPSAWSPFVNCFDECTKRFIAAHHGPMWQKQDQQHHGPMWQKQDKPWFMLVSRWQCGYSVDPMLSSSISSLWLPGKPTKPELMLQVHQSQFLTFMSGHVALLEIHVTYRPQRRVPRWHCSYAVTVTQKHQPGLTALGRLQNLCTPPIK